MMSRGCAIGQAVPHKDVLEHLQQQNAYCSNFLNKYIVIAISEISTFVLICAEYQSAILGYEHYVNFCRPKGATVS